jgi:hypothetical protein
VAKVDMPDHLKTPTMLNDDPALVSEKFLSRWAEFARSGDLGWTADNRETAVPVTFYANSRTEILRYTAEREVWTRGR